MPVARGIKSCRIKLFSLERKKRTMKGKDSY